ncbi:hypothetical protein GCM10007880_58510 [Mesorhizobium amorphae]|nr:hypothetical protein GCM10007880_58510 [Mesorhizobium amorphae]
MPIVEPVDSDTALHRSHVDILPQQLGIIAKRGRMGTQVIAATVRRRLERDQDRI